MAETLLTTAPNSTGSATMADLLAGAADRHRGTALRYCEGSTWIEVSYSELGRIADEVARGLMALGVERGDRVAILSNARPEWTVCDLAALSVGAIVVPVYQTNSPGECHHVLEHSDAKVVLCEDAEQVAKIRQIRNRLPALETVVAFEDGGDSSLSMDQLRARGAEVEDSAVQSRTESVSPEDPATIIYTSGTTGPPKGCVLTHANYRANITMVQRRIDLSAQPLVFYVFLPLAHALTRIVQMLALDVGATLAYWRRDPAAIVGDLHTVEPTHLPAVPRIFEKVHAKATSRAAAAGRMRELMFGWAIRTGREMHDARGDEHAAPGLRLSLRHRVADRLVLSKVRELFGTRIELALTGAAPIDPEILEFFLACGVPVLEGYGMTETSAVAAVNTLSEMRLGTVGRPLPGCELRIAEDGEVLMRGPHVFQGYFKDAEATEGALDRDGWLHSGDLGSVDGDGFLTITGRKKDIIVTSSGKNITPANVENALRGCRWISQAVVYGDRRPYLVALVTLDHDEAPALAEKVGARPDIEELAAHPGVRAEIVEAVERANGQFARIEQVKRFSILARDLSQDEDELTPTLKVRRQAVYDRHADLFAALYEQA